MTIMKTMQAKLIAKTKEIAMLEAALAPRSIILRLKLVPFRPRIRH
jgi:hypothetical protein